MARADVMRQISALLDRECENCITKRNIAANYRYPNRALAEYCNKHCLIGAQLRELGSQLGREADKTMSAPRQHRREWVHEIKAKGEEYGAGLYEGSTDSLEQEGEEVKASQS